MAYTTVPAESKILSDAQKSCTAIVSLERLGRYSGGVVGFLKEIKADVARSLQRPPPGPGGG
jgi:hypothetical protein